MPRFHHIFYLQKIWNTCFALFWYYYIIFFLFFKKKVGDITVFALITKASLCSFFLLDTYIILSNWNSFPFIFLSLNFQCLIISILMELRYGGDHVFCCLYGTIACHTSRVRVAMKIIAHHTLAWIYSGTGPLWWLLLLLTSLRKLRQAKHHSPCKHEWSNTVVYSTLIFN